MSKTEYNIYVYHNTMPIFLFVNSFGAWDAISVRYTEGLNQHPKIRMYECIFQLFYNN